jgi:triacylglycerol esterase/lipase EstA (alpha/beta hydrolase family)
MRRRLPLLALALVVLAAAAVAVVASTRHSADASSTHGRRAAAKALRCATPSHPDPVVLVPGTFDMTSWTDMAPALAKQGYCVERFVYPNAGVGPIQQSATALRRFVDRVLTRTGASRVSFVTHSQGGLVARYSRTEAIPLAHSAGVTAPMVDPAPAAGRVQTA